MTQVSPSAAYIRKGESADQPTLPVANSRNSPIEEQVWTLLETPQTVESLQRAANRSATGQPLTTDRSHIESTLERLLDADLIELSPDS